MLSNEDRVWTIVESKSAAYFDLSDKIWDAPELNYQEFTAASLHADLLKREGFSIKSGVAGMPTAVMGEAGKDGPVIAFLGEYDALPGLSQEAGVARHQPLIVGGPGHGCGHNMLGAAALLAAASIKEWLRTAGLPGRVRYYGCPAEEEAPPKALWSRRAPSTMSTLQYVGIRRPLPEFLEQYPWLASMWTSRSMAARLTPRYLRSSVAVHWMRSS